MLTFKGLLQAAAFIRPSVEPSVFMKSLYIHRKSLFSSYTVLQMTSRASHMIVSEMDHCIICYLLSGFYLLGEGGGGGGGGGEDSPPNTPASPPKFLPIKSYSVLVKNLSVIPQLLEPQNCLRMPQNHSQKAQNSKTFCGGTPLDPLENCGLWVQLPSIPSSICTSLSSLCYRN